MKRSVLLLHLTSVMWVGLGMADTTIDEAQSFTFGTVSNSRGKHEGDGEAIHARIVSASTSVQGSIVATVAKVDGTP